MTKNDTLQALSVARDEINGQWIGIIPRALELEEVGNCAGDRVTNRKAFDSANGNGALVDRQFASRE